MSAQGFEEFLILRSVTVPVTEGNLQAAGDTSGGVFGSSRRGCRHYVYRIGGDDEQGGPDGMSVTIGPKTRMHSVNTPTLPEWPPRASPGVTTRLKASSPLMTEHRWNCHLQMTLSVLHVSGPFSVSFRSGLPPGIAGWQNKAAPACPRFTRGQSGTKRTGKQRAAKSPVV